MLIMTITQLAIDSLKGNNKLKAHIAIAHNCTVYTIDRWIRKKDYKHLTSAIALHLEIFQAQSGLSMEEIFEPDYFPQIKDQSLYEDLLRKKMPNLPN